MGAVQLPAAALREPEHDVNRRLREDIMELRQAVIAAQLQCASFQDVLELPCPFLRIELSQRSPKSRAGSAYTWPLTAR